MPQRVDLIKSTCPPLCFDLTAPISFALCSVSDWFKTSTDNMELNKCKDVLQIDVFKLDGIRPFIK